MQSHLNPLETLLRLIVTPENSKSSVCEVVEAIEIEIDSLQSEDYLKLLAHQKKSLNDKRWRKLTAINQGLTLEPSHLKYFFMIISQANYRRLEHPNYYAQLLMEQKKYPEQFFSPIEKDVYRTLSAEHPFHKALSNVLSAYAIRNPTLLYCQGMNYLVSYILINGLTEEQAFWFLVCLIENVLPDDYFKNLSTIIITSNIFADLAPFLISAFKRQMDAVGMDSSIFLVGWFVCLFTKGFVNSVSAYLLGLLLLDSRIHSVGYTLLKISFAIIITVLSRQEPFQCKKDFKSLKEKFEEKVFQISLSEIKKGIGSVQISYQYYLELEKIYLDKQPTRTQNILSANKKLLLPVCSKEYPVCLHRVEIEKRIGVEEIYILKNGTEIRSQYCENYLNEDQESTKVISYESIDDCLITRHSHICLSGQKITENGLAHFQYKQEFKRERECGSRESFHEQIPSNYNKIENVFSELSGFFVVDDKYGLGEEEMEPQLEQSEEKQKEEKFSLGGKIGGTVIKVWDRLLMLRENLKNTFSFKA